MSGVNTRQEEGKNIGIVTLKIRYQINSSLWFVSSRNIIFMLSIVTGFTH